MNAVDIYRNCAILAVRVGMKNDMQLWVVENLNDAVDAEFAALPKDIQAKFLRLAELVEEVGLTSLHKPYVKHLQGKLWELRVKGKTGLGRGLYCTV